MKKSKAVSLVLLSTLFACQQQNRYNTRNPQSRLHMRSDTTSGYSRSYYGGSSGGRIYTAFRPYSTYSSSTGTYTRSGYQSSAISKSSNPRTSSIRGGFGGGGRVSASS
jgi:hypothetical protein